MTRVVPLMLTAACVLVATVATASHAEQLKPFSVVQAEAIPVAKTKGKIIKALSTSSKRVVRLERKVGLTFAAEGKITSVTVRVRANKCNGAPQYRLRVNGKVLALRTVKRGTWRNYRVTVKSPVSGRQQVSLAFANPGKAKHCRRGLQVDWIGVRSSSDAAPPTIVSLGEGTSARPVDNQSQFRADSPQATGTQPINTPGPTPAPAPFSAPVAAQATSSPSGISRLYANPDSKAAATADLWRKSRPNDAKLMDKLASSSVAFWVGGWTNELQILGNTLRAAKADRARLPIAVYGIPNRDTGKYSAGGHSGPEAYRDWIDDVARTIGGNATLIVVEPDAAATMLPDGEQGERYAMLAYAVAKLSALPDSLVYLDAGNSSWRTPAEIVARLKASGIDKADGFASNTSNFRFTSDEIAWGRQVSAGLGGKHMVIDTSRNGRGPLPGATGEASWCNPPGRGIGSRATMATGVAGVDAFIWAKTPGSSDGSCFGYPAAGTYQPEVALAMAKNGIW